jgi:hypothetical protein
MPYWTQGVVIFHVYEETNEKISISPETSYSITHQETKYTAFLTENGEQCRVFRTNLTFAFHDWLRTLLVQAAFSKVSVAIAIDDDWRVCSVRIGYSLPPDDVEYRAIFSACRRHHERQDRQERVRCTIVDKHPPNLGWHGPEALKSLNYLNHPTVKAARDIFGPDNIRFYGGGIPDVFLDAGGQATADKLEQLLDWSSTPT